MTWLLLLSCDMGAPPAPAPITEAGGVPEPAPTTPSRADVTAVTVEGAPGAYTFVVTVASPDTGCAQYADWWEVLTPGGALKYRRVLGHSHADEQPFTRDGGPVPVAADEVVVVRAHMNPGGYGGAALRGTVAGGFTAAPDVDATFAASVAGAAPLPEGCAF